MEPVVLRPYVSTQKELCRMCYTCVRECPAKAIQIAEGQAQVIPQRCIGCGNCVSVCSQRAKAGIDTTLELRQLLAADGLKAAMVAPSFPAEFNEIGAGQLVAMIRRLGFDLVCEVSFGADLVADRYRALFKKSNGDRYIATTCPAIVGFVERYHPELVPALSPIVSPMVAMGRVLRREHPGVKVAFIGPCIAKKMEGNSKTMPGEVDGVITFAELRAVFEQDKIAPQEESDFDPPHPGSGALFPLARGILQAAGIEEDLASGEVVATDGRSNFVVALKEFADGNLDAKLLEVLCCQGCIMGPGMSTRAPLFRRRSHVSRYVRERLAAADQAKWRENMERFADLDLTRPFAANDQRMAPPNEEELFRVMRRMGKQEPQDELNCGACGYDTCREHAIAVCRGLAESEMCLPYTIERLRRTIGELAESNSELANVQEALMQSEKLASMGQLAAGIAHEVNNPLGVVLMYAHLMLDECEDGSQNRQDLQMIAEQADRCKKIVAGLLHFARQNKVLKQPVDVGDLIGRSLRSVPRPDNVEVEVRNDLQDPFVDLDPDQMQQVFTNLISNAYAAMPEGGKLTVQAGANGDRVSLWVRDSGTGIPREHLKRIFDPFFTTKQIGMGTGLGLAVTYGIVKMHCGSIRVESNTDLDFGPTGTAFVIDLPRRGEGD